jgi:hypothetical protein
MSGRCWACVPTKSTPPSASVGSEMTRTSTRSESTLTSLRLCGESQRRSLPADKSASRSFIDLSDGASEAAASRRTHSSRERTTAFNASIDAARQQRHALLSAEAARPRPERDLLCHRTRTCACRGDNCSALIPDAAHTRLPAVVPDHGGAAVRTIALILAASPRCVIALATTHELRRAVGMLPDPDSDESPAERQDAAPRRSCA